MSPSPDLLIYRKPHHVSHSPRSRQPPPRPVQTRPWYCDRNQMTTATPSLGLGGRVIPRRRRDRGAVACERGEKGGTSLGTPPPLDAGARPDPKPLVEVNTCPLRLNIPGGPTLGVSRQLPLPALPSTYDGRPFVAGKAINYPHDGTAHPAPSQPYGVSVVDLLRLRCFLGQSLIGPKLTPGETPFCSWSARVREVVAGRWARVRAVRRHRAGYSLRR